MKDVLGEIGFYTLSDARARGVATEDRPRLSRCEILLGSRCNFRCPYCRHVGGPDAEFEQVKKTLDLWIADGLRAVRFSGGEPTLWPHLRDIVDYAAERIDRVAISTNGSASADAYLALVDAGANDFSISLDACCASDGSMMSGGVDGAWETVIANIRELARITYVTVGVVLTEQNASKVSEIVRFALNLGVSDVRVIPAAQHSSIVLSEPISVTAGYPILRWRSERFRDGKRVRGIGPCDSSRCSLVLDDMAVMGGKHYPCIIYLREGGKPIGTVGPHMRDERAEWFRHHRSDADPICSRNCLDFCVHHNNRVDEFRALGRVALKCDALDGQTSAAL